MPTRSIHRLPATPPRREHVPHEVGPARAARSAFDYTWLLVLVALLGIVLGAVARVERFVLTLPHGTAERIDDLTVMAASAAVVALAIGLLALAVWSVRRIGVGLARRHQRIDLTSGDRA